MACTEYPYTPHCNNNPSLLATSISCHTNTATLIILVSFMSVGSGSVNSGSGSISGSGSLLYIKELKKFKKKVQYFIIFNDLLPVGQHIFFIGHKSVQIGNGRIRWPPRSGSIIHNSGSGSERNIYGSTTLFLRRRVSALKS
jgi:hypothetical protein